jgi:hypothetical protein
VALRPEPNKFQSPIGSIPEGESPEYHRFTDGQSIDGYQVWLNVTYGGVTGYYSSRYDNGNYDPEDQITDRYGIPPCGDTIKVASVSDPSPTNAGYRVRYLQRGHSLARSVEDSSVRRQYCQRRRGRR